MYQSNDFLSLWLYSTSLNIIHDLKKGAIHSIDSLGHSQIYRKH